MARRLLILACLAATAVTVSACGSQDVQVAKNDPDRKGAVLFAERCSGCHTLEAAGTEGSSENVRHKERTDGPNLDTRKESVADVLFAIQNGGFSGAIMPENIATGAEAQAIAQFVAKYAGKQSGSK